MSRETGGYDPNKETGKESHFEVEFARLEELKNEILKLLRFIMQKSFAEANPETEETKEAQEKDYVTWTKIPPEVDRLMEFVEDFRHSLKRF